MDISPTWGSLLFSLWIPRCVDKPIGLLSFILLQYINFGSPEPVSRPLALSVPVALTVEKSLPRELILRGHEDMTRRREPCWPAPSSVSSPQDPLPNRSASTSPSPNRLPAAHRASAAHPLLVYKRRVTRTGLPPSSRLSPGATSRRR